MSCRLLSIHKPQPIVATSTTIPSTSDPVEWTQAGLRAREGESGPAGKESRSVCEEDSVGCWLIFFAFAPSHCFCAEPTKAAASQSRPVIAARDTGEGARRSRADAGSSQLSFAALPQARRKRSRPAGRGAVSTCLVGYDNNTSGSNTSNNNDQPASRPSVQSRPPPAVATASRRPRHSPPSEPLAWSD